MPAIGGKNALTSSCPLLTQSGHRPGYKPRINLWPLALEIELIQYASVEIGTHGEKNFALFVAD